MNACYHAPDTSDKTPEESWLAYWDRKRRERHSADCSCVLCANESLLDTLGRTLLPEEWREVLYGDDNAPSGR
jgi:hypothetical protein